MKNYYKKYVAQVAQVALSFIGKGYRAFFGGTFVAQVAQTQNWFGTSGTFVAQTFSVFTGVTGGKCHKCHKCHTVF